MKNLQIRSLLLMAAAIVALGILSLIAVWKVNYVPRKDMNMVQLKADSLLSVKLELEKELKLRSGYLDTLETRNRELNARLNAVKWSKGSAINEKENLRQQLNEMKQMIITYQSQMRSLIIANEKLEKKVQSLALELK